MLEGVLIGWRLLWRDRRGSTAIEYALIAALIGSAVVFLVMDIGNTLVGFFTHVSTGMKTS
jgi:Flp pilus assembly pilin Flp